VTETDKRDRGTVLALAAMAVAVLVIANDFTALSVALPSIEVDLHTDLSTVQWVINAYALVFGVLIVTGGRLADMFGRRRMFVVGAGIFAGFSVLGGVAPDDLWLIGCRAAMGIGGALMWPAILGMTFALLPASRAGLAGGLIMGAAGFGNAIGPLLGGVLTDELSWRWIFFLNLPIAAFAVWVTLRAIKPGASGSTTPVWRRCPSGWCRCCWRSTSPATGAGAIRGSSPSPWPAPSCSSPSWRSSGARAPRP